MANDDTGCPPHCCCGAEVCCDCGEPVPYVVRDKATKPTAADVLHFLDYFAGQEDEAADVRDFVQEAARMIDEGKSLYDFGMSGLASFVEWYWEDEAVKWRAERTPKIVGYMGYHATEAPNGQFETVSMTEADRAAGWTEAPVYQEGEPA